MESKTDLDSLVSRPLNSLEEILEWEKHVVPYEVESLHERSKFSVSGSSFLCHSNNDSDWKHVELNTGQVPRTLICHDMKGGYIEDRYVNGTETPDAYRFFHWAGIDSFVYFSHHLLTIPPSVWITAGHVHGVKVLGTFITEWDCGEATWKEILSAGDTRASYVEKMVEICEKFGFDGYLLNVENKLEEKYVSKLLQFVKDLHRALHKKLPQAELIWYDSIITTGELKWQNELNELNKPFFDRCDGILLNYPWKEEHLARSAALAGPARLADVYAGVDVFGRGSFGGGGFGAADALAAARREGLSAAVFAPGWTYEAFDGRHFACTEHLFWARLRPHLHVRGPAALPLRTSFCQGFGRRGHAQWGRPPPLPAARPWYHLGKQRLQPSVASCLDPKCTPVPDRPPPPPPRKPKVDQQVDEGKLSPEPCEETEAQTVTSEPLAKKSKIKPPSEIQSESVVTCANECSPKATNMIETVPNETGSGSEGAAQPSSEDGAGVAAPQPAPAPEPQVPAPAPDCCGCNRGCVQHFEGDAFFGGGCVQVRRAPSEGDGLSMHRLFLCDLQSASGRLRVVRAVKRGPGAGGAEEEEDGGTPLRLALVLRDAPSAQPRLVWVDEVDGCLVQRSADGKKWEPVNNVSFNMPTSWRVWDNLVSVSGRVVEILAALPAGCNSALLGWLEITEAPNGE